MFKNISDWVSDEKLELEGVPVELGKGRKIFVKRAGGANRAFKVAVADLLRELAGAGDPEDIPDSVLEPRLPQVYAQHVVTGWLGFIDENDQAIPFTPENFVELMRIAPDMWVEVRVHAKQRESFQQVLLEQEKTTLGKS